MTRARFGDRLCGVYTAASCRSDERHEKDKGVSKRRVAVTTSAGKMVALSRPSSKQNYGAHSNTKCRLSRPQARLLQTASTPQRNDARADISSLFCQRSH